MTQIKINLDMHYLKWNVCDLKVNARLTDAAVMSAAVRRYHFIAADPDFRDDYVFFSAAPGSFIFFSKPKPGAAIQPKTTLCIHY